MATSKESAIVDIGAYEFGAPCDATTLNKQICAGESFNGWTTPGTYRLNLTNMNQCDSVVFVNLTLDNSLGKPAFTVSGDTLRTTATGQLQWFLNGQPISNATGLL